MNERIAKLERQVRILSAAVVVLLAGLVLTGAASPQRFGIIEADGVRLFDASTGDLTLVAPGLITVENRSAGLSAAMGTKFGSPAFMVNAPGMGVNVSANPGKGAAVFVRHDPANASGMIVAGPNGAVVTVRDNDGISALPGAPAAGNAEVVTGQ